MSQSKMTCGNEWPAVLVWAYGMSDLVMLVGYLIVAFLFFSYLRPRHVTVLRQIFSLLGWVFILCGMTHGTRIIGFFWYVPWLVVMTAAISSVITVILLVSIIPKVPMIMKFPSASKMSRANSDLREEISNLLDANAKLATVDNVRAVANIDCAIKAIRDLSVTQQTTA